MQLIKIIQNQQVRAVLDNSVWLAAERLLRSLTGFVFVVWMARILGPVQFGQLNLAQSIVISLLPIAMLGIGGSLVKDLAQNPKERDALLSSAMVLRGVALFVALPSLLGVTWVVSAGDLEVLSLVLVLSLVMISVVTDSVECYLQATMNNRMLVLLKLGPFVVSTVLKILLLVLEASVIWFAVVISFESLLSTILLGVYAKGKSFAYKFAWVPHLAKRLIKQAIPLAVVALVASIYARLDLILLGHFVPYGQMGIYSAAWKILEAMAFFPAIIVTATAPLLARYHKQSDVVFDEKLGQLLRWLFWFVLVMVILASLGAEIFMTRLFGEIYADAVPVFEILVWVIVPLLFNLFTTQAAINAGKLRFLAETGCIGLVSGLLLGIILIPLWGIYGAAISALLSHILAYMVYGGLSPVGRSLVRFQSVILWR